MSKENLSINLRVIRPFFQYSADRLFETIQTSLSENYPDLEIATLAYDKLKLRKKAGGGRGIRTLDTVTRILI